MPFLIYAVSPCFLVSLFWGGGALIMDMDSSMDSESIMIYVTLPGGVYPTLGGQAPSDDCATAQSSPIMVN